MVKPSLDTLEKTVATRVYLENFYFSLLSEPNPREARRLALERDMKEMALSTEAKRTLRERWRRNETDHLRDRRRQISVNAFVKLKTIGRGQTLFFIGVSTTSYF